MKHNDLKKENNNFFGECFELLPYLALICVAIYSFIYLFFIKETPENKKQLAINYEKRFEKDIVVIETPNLTADIEVLLETSKKLNYELKGFSVKDEQIDDSYIFIFEKKEVKNEN